MRLKKEQKEYLLTLVAEGLKSDQINAHAAQFDPPFEVSRAQVDFYRASRGVVLEEITQASESDALRAGFAVKEERIEALTQIAALIYADLQSGIHAGDGAAFKESAVRQWRGLLDDIAKESGGRNYKNLDESADQPNEVKITVAYEDKKPLTD